MSRLPSLAVVLSLALTSAPVRADLQQPGSLLLFPLADARSGSLSILTLTNTDPDPAHVLEVMCVHIDGTDCLPMDRVQRLPAGDTLSVALTAFVPTGEQGFLYAYARSATTQQAVSANHLIGNILALDGAAGSEFQVPAIAFVSPQPYGSPTDLDLDGLRDLNGIEYAPVADELLFPRFLGQSTSFQSELVLLSLSGGRDFTAFANLVIANDDRDFYSAQMSFRCWTRRRLMSISGVFANSFLLSTGHNPVESAGGRESGWFSVDGSYATSGQLTLFGIAVVGLLVEPSVHSSAALPFARGTQDNGDLFHTGSNGGNGG